MKKNAHTVKRTAAAVLCTLFVLPSLLSLSGTAQAMDLAEYEQQTYYKNEASVFAAEPDEVVLSTQNVPALSETNYTADLDGTWKMISNGSITKLKKGEGWESAINATVPGSIYTALMEAGVIDDPYVGDNMKTANSYSQRSWYLSRTFDYSGSGKNVKLCFEGVCNVADFYLNGTKIGSHEGMFGGPYIDVSDVIKQGENLLVVQLKPAKDYTQTVVFNCSYGWHYAKLYPLGIWHSVSLRDEPSVTLDSPFITTTDYTKGTVDLAINLIPKDGGAVKGTLTVEIVPKNFSGTASYFSAAVNGSGETLLRYRADVPDAHLWWPNGYGEQDLYELKTSFKAEDGSASYSVSEFGIRQLDYAPFPSGESRYAYNRQFVINGVDVYMKGAGWCTSDAMMRFTREDYDRILSRAHDAGINYFRSWGGGLVETDEFYDLCDEYGICIYQEWPCCWDSTKTQPADVLYETVILGAKRLRNRPSLVVWGGGNEGEAPYDDAVLNNMGKLTYETDGTRDFWRQDGGTGASNIRHDHIWWSGDTPEHYLKLYAGSSNLNMSEYGLGSMMNRQSIEKFASESELTQWPIKSNNSIAYHTATFNGYYGWNPTPHGYDIDTHMYYASLFTDEESLDGMIIGSQLSQAQADYPLAMMQRTKAPSNTVNVIYKLNDNYPGASWSIVDWYGAPKIAYYLMQDAYRPVMAAFTTKRYNTLTINGSISLSLPVYILDDTVSLKGVPTSVKVTAYDERLNVVKTEEFEGVTEQTVNKLGNFKLTAVQTDHTPLIITADLYTNGEFYNRTYMYFNYEYDSGCLFYLPRTNLEYTVSGNTVRIKNTGDVIAVGVNLKSSADDKFVCSDNYFILTPGQSADITVNDAKLFTGIDCFNFADAKDVTPPSAPSGITVTDISTDSVKVIWSESTDDTGLFKYTVVVKSGDSELTLPVHKTKTELLVDGLSEATDYSVTVTATDNNGNISAVPDPVAFKTSKDTSAPSVLSAEFTDDGRIKVEFSTEMDKESAEDVSHYLLNYNASVTGAVLDDNGTTLYLDTEGCDEAKTYALGIIGLKDTRLSKNDTGYISVKVERGLYMSVDFEADAKGRSYSAGKLVGQIEEINGAAKFTDDGADGRALSVSSGYGVKVGGVKFSYQQNSSVTLWIKGKATAGYNLLLAKGPKETGHFEFYLNSGALWIYAPDIGDINLNYNINDGPTGWRMLAFVREGVKLKVYDDGKLVSTTTFRGKIAERTSDMSFGALNDGTLSYAGSIDSVRLYERALKEDEIAEIAKYGSAALNGSGGIAFRSDVVELSPGESLPCGITAADGVKYTLTLRGDAASLEGDNFNASAPGEAIACAVSEDGKYIAMTLIKVIDPADTEPEETEPDETEPEETEPDVTEPEETEPEETEPEETEPDVTEPDVTEPDETEPDVTEPDETEPDETEPDETEPDATEPEETEPDVTEPEETEPDETEPEETEPDETEPEETEPEETEPEETEPEAFEPGDINGDKEINNKDVVALFRYVSGGTKAENEEIYDYNKDGEANNKDVVSLFRFVSSVK